MGKIVYFTPAILFTVLYAWLASLNAGPISPMVFVWIGLFATSGILLAKGMFWGGFLGMLPGLYLMYMSTVDTGQVIHIEMPLGIAVVAFYLICGGYVLYRQKKKA